ncbi:hypothetical protein F5H01DRAFT_372119 [Linnemannia elongata]|nr:hypothetical protein F5H01DRAFT_372119 [Linnemannia elongata]
MSRRHDHFFGVPRVVDGPLFLPSTTSSFDAPPVAQPTQINNNDDNNNNNNHNNNDNNNNNNTECHGCYLWVNVFLGYHRGLIIVDILVAYSTVSELLPAEGERVLSLYLTDPLDLLRFSYTCHALFSLITPADWYSLATYTYPSLVQSFGDPKARDWKTMVLKDAALRVRLGATIPLPDAFATSATVIRRLEMVAMDEFDRHRPLRVELSEAQFFKTDRETQDTPGTPWVRMGSPIYNIDRDSQTAIAASMITRPKSVPPKRNGGDPRPHDHEILFYNLPDLTNPIARCGSDVWEKNKTTGTQALPDEVAQVVAIKHYPEDTVGGMRVIFVIAIGQRARSWVNIIADSHILGNWMMLKVIEVRLPVTPMTRLSSLMMNHFQASPSLELKIARECVRFNPDSVLKYESLEPRQHQITMHGCFVKLYSAFDPRPFPTATTGGGQPSTPLDVDTGRKVDCIAIFGIQNSDAASAMVMKKVLFCDDDGSDLGGKTFSNKAVSREATCMTLFPDHSGYEHYLVLYIKEGRGMVWDWVHEKQITQLHLPIDKCKSKGDRRAGDEPANIGVVADGALATARNPTGDASVGEPSLPRRKMYYWGVQVSAAFNVSFPGDPKNAYNSNGAFRIVTMGDSADDEWESCWWDITMDELQEPMASLSAPPIIDRSKSGSRLKTTISSTLTPFLEAWVEPAARDLGKR